MHRTLRPGHLPAIGMALARSALQPDELGLSAAGSERRGDAVALHHVHVVIPRPVYRQKRNIGPRKGDGGDVAQFGFGPGRTMTHHIRHDLVEVVHHLFGRHGHVVLAIQVDGRAHPSVRAGGIVTQRDHRRQVAAG